MAGGADGVEGVNGAAEGGGGPPCPDCRGSGIVPLLVGKMPCKTCGGTGKAPAPSAPPAAPAGLAEPIGPEPAPARAARRPVVLWFPETEGPVTYTYDDSGRLARVAPTACDAAGCGLAGD